MKVKLSSIEMDVTIQCRVTINPDVVTEYAERMAAGDVFPPPTLFGTEDRSWPGDGWQRLLARLQLGKEDVEADLRPGGREEALLFALSANTTHGSRRTNADKHKCAEIALDRWPDWSDRKLAEVCALSDPFIGKVRAQVLTVRTLEGATRTGRDGKQYKSGTRCQSKPAAVNTTTETAATPATEPISPQVTTSNSQNSLAVMKGWWERATKQERERFLNWTMEIDTPQGTGREVWSLVSKLQRMLRREPELIDTVTKALRSADPSRTCYVEPGVE